MVCAAAVQFGIPKKTDAPPFLDPNDLIFEAEVQREQQEQN
jgi:hypothetical protein